MKNIDREIEVVEAILNILNKCWALHDNENQPEQCEAVLNDISLVKQELRKLIESREAERVPLEDARF
jgi:hypothetical protein